MLIERSFGFMASNKIPTMVANYLFIAEFAGFNKSLTVSGTFKIQNENKEFTCTLTLERFKKLWIIIPMWNQEDGQFPKYLTPKLSTHRSKITLPVTSVVMNNKFQSDQNLMQATPFQSLFNGAI